MSAGPATQPETSSRLVCRGFGSDNAIKLISQAAAFDAADVRQLAPRSSSAFQVKVMPPDSVIRYVTDSVSRMNLDGGIAMKNAAAIYHRLTTSSLGLLMQVTDAATAFEQRTPPPRQIWSGSGYG